MGQTEGCRDGRSTMKPSLHSWDRSDMFMACNSFYISLDLICLVFSLNIFLCRFLRDVGVVFSLLVLVTSLSGFFFGLVKWVWNCFSQLSVTVCMRCCYFFLKCLIEFIREATCP